MTETQREVLDVLLAGGKITGKQIAMKVGLKIRDTGKEGADLRAIVNALRRKGYPICADSNGYWYANNTGELVDYIASLQGRIDKETEALNGLKSILDNNNFIPKGIKEPMPPMFMVEYQKLAENSYKVKGTYNVVKDEIYGWQCDCEAFRFSGKRKTCKHLEKLLAYLKAETQREALKNQSNLF